MFEKVKNVFYINMIFFVQAYFEHQKNFIMTFSTARKQPQLQLLRIFHTSIVLNVIVILSTSKKNKNLKKYLYKKKYLIE